MAYLAKTTSKGRDYYKIMESYRTKDGVKHRTLFNIGTLGDVYKLLPDDYKRKNAVPKKDKDNAAVDIILNPVRCRIHGAPFLMYSIAQWLGVQELMDEIFPPKTANSIKRSLSLLLAAIHRSCDPGSKRMFSSWFSHTSLPDYINLDPKVFTSQHFWEQMDDISIEQIQTFETALYQRICAQFPESEKKESCLSSDFTNYYTYISNQNYRCTIAQLGHSKEGRTGQRIFCVAVVMSPLLGIPIATMVYPGNDNDKTALRNFFAELNTRLKDIIDLEKMTYVFDGGGTSEESLNLIPGSFITRGSLHSSPELYEVPLNSYEKITLEDGKTAVAYRTTAKQFGKDRTVIVSLSDELEAGQTRELDKQIGKFFEQIDELNKRLTNPRATTDRRQDAMTERIERLLLPQFHFSDFIEVSYKTVMKRDPVLEKQFVKAEKLARKNGTKASIIFEGKEITSKDSIPVIPLVTSVECAVNEEKKQAMIDKYYGKHLLVTSLDDWSTDKILNVYRDQEYIERFFRDSKDVDHFSVRPAYHWTDQKLRVHVMICYMGLTLCRTAVLLLKEKFNYCITCHELLDRLTCVQECLVTMSLDGKGIKPMKTLSELEGKDKEVWGKVSLLLKYMEANSAEPLTASK